MPSVWVVFFNDKYFSDSVYSDRSTSSTPDLLAAHRRGVPDDPVVHATGGVGVSSRWWYLSGMYTPTVESCHCCSGKESPGQQFARRMAETTSGPVVDRTSQLYRIPVAMISGDQAKECISWPRYCHGEFSFQNTTGSSMLELSLDERRALVILVLRTSVQQEKYGAAHHHNWKKVGLSRAYYKKELVCEQSMPTDRSKAAFRFLMANNMYYKVFRGYQKICIDTGSSHNLSSYDLFVCSCCCFCCC